MHTTFADIDECAEGVDKCRQKCVNTIGSFHCDCYAGYGLRSNNRNCKGDYIASYILNFYHHTMLNRY